MFEGPESSINHELAHLVQQVQAGQQARQHAQRQRPRAAAAALAAHGDGRLLPLRRARPPCLDTVQVQGMDVTRCEFVAAAHLSCSVQHEIRDIGSLMELVSRTAG